MHFEVLLTPTSVNPYGILVRNILPNFAEDSHEMVVRIFEQAKSRGEEVGVQDGFDLYKQLASIRGLFAEALPEYELRHIWSIPANVCSIPFPFHVEGLFEGFVWQWISLTDQKVMDWVEQAIRKDQFTVRVDDSTEAAAEDYRHSVSVIDIFRSFNQVVDQLVQLEWDDDFQYAKFMTALSKTIGKGVSRYCESIEQLFAKEMDRLSPDQEAAMTQTAQEKLMQFAKEAWTTKEKMEPFQFFPEVRSARYWYNCPLTIAVSCQVE